MHYCFPQKKKKKKLPIQTDMHVNMCWSLVNHVMSTVGSCGEFETRSWRCGGRNEWQW